MYAYFYFKSYVDNCAAGALTPLILVFVQSVLDTAPKPTIRVLDNAGGFLEKSLFGQNNVAGGNFFRSRIRAGTKKEQVSNSLRAFECIHYKGRKFDSGFVFHTWDDDLMPLCLFPLNFPFPIYNVKNKNSNTQPLFSLSITYSFSL